MTSQTEAERRVVLAVGGSDPTGGAGIQADLKTIAAHGLFGTAVIAAVTAQNSQGVQAILPMEPLVVKSQLDSLYTEVTPYAVKTGMLYSGEIIKEVARVMSAHPPRFLVVDPVMAAGQGGRLMATDALEALEEALLPSATLITPNLREAEVLAGKRISTVGDIRLAAQRIFRRHHVTVLIKGGHLSGPPLDLLFDGGRFYEFSGERVEGPVVHGTGCALASAIACRLTAGMTIREAVRTAKEFVTQGIKNALPTAGNMPLFYPPSLGTAKRNR